MTTLAETPITPIHEHATPVPPTVIEPPKGWQVLNVGELWRARELIFFLAWRDVKVRYKQTILGAAWAILQPMMMMVVFTIFFGRMAKVPAGDVPYPLFVLAGLLPWTFFASAVSAAGNSVLGSERLITKIYFPRLAVPLASVGAAMVDFVVACGLLAVMAAYYRVQPTANLLLVPLTFVLIATLALGLGHAPGGLERVVPRLQVHDPVHDPARDVRHADGLHGPDQGGRGPIRVAPDAQPDDAAGRHLPVRDPGRPDPLGAAGSRGHGVLHDPPVGCLYFRKVEDSFADII